MSQHATHPGHLFRTQTLNRLLYLDHSVVGNIDSGYSLSLIICVMSSDVNILPTYQRLLCCNDVY